MERLVRLLTWGAFLLAVHDALVQWADRSMDAELRRMCEQAWRP